MATTPLITVLDIPRSPAAVRRWWWEIPDAYEAADPREEPHRIRVRAREPGRLDLVTWWRTPDGRVAEAPEVLSMTPEGGWTADITVFGVRIQDHFTLEATREGTRVTVRSTLTPATWKARMLAWWLLPRVKREMTRIWRNAAVICARDAPRA